MEQLTNAVGISKGAFYKFLDSKELLFFAMLEDIHTEGYAAAAIHAAGSLRRRLSYSSKMMQNFFRTDYRRK